MTFDRPRLDPAASPVISRGRHPAVGPSLAWPVGCAPVRRRAARQRAEDGYHRLEALPNARSGSPAGSGSASFPGFRRPRARARPSASLPARPAHELGEAGGLAVDDRAGRLRRDVARSEAGPTGGDDQAERPPSASSRTSDLDRGPLVGDDARAGHLEAASRRMSSAASPDSSARVPAVTPSDTVTTAARTPRPCALSCQTGWHRRIDSSYHVLPTHDERIDDGRWIDQLADALGEDTRPAGDRGLLGGAGRRPSRRAQDHTSRGLPPRLGGWPGPRRGATEPTRFDARSHADPRAPASPAEVSGGRIRRAGVAWRSSMDAGTTSSPPPSEGPLLDTFGRVADDLRISVTDRCNFRCVYCMPAEGLRLAPEGRDPHVRGAHSAARVLRDARGPLREGHRRRAHRPGRPADARPDVPGGRRPTSTCR